MEIKAVIFGFAPLSMCNGVKNQDNCGPEVNGQRRRRPFGESVLRTLFGGVELRFFGGADFSDFCRLFDSHVEG
ncbi:hypothetical protein ACPTJS_15980, partial [Enterococcus faecalis]|uniref:hypothetical protein n=1 Tax=Enterococcus faecalis TaxID=1351 RepID=UPI003CC6936F